MEKLCAEELALAFAGLVLVDTPLSLGKLPFASRMLVISWAEAGVTQNMVSTSAVLILILVCLCRGCHFVGTLTDGFLVKIASLLFRARITPRSCDPNPSCIAIDDQIAQRALEPERCHSVDVLQGATS